MKGILGIDTASARFAVGLTFGPGGGLRLKEQAAEQDHSRLLLSAVRDILGTEPGGVEAIVVVTGPGSYAGIRVGVATAQALAFAWGVPVFGVGTMEAAATACSKTEVTIVHPAGRGEFAMQKWANGHPEGPIRVVPGDDLRDTGLAGEGAGPLGGTEIDSSERLTAALKLVAAGSRTAGADVIYSREPNITAPRRQTPTVARV
jgi:tRNA threonylcarbamoyl adenosine modification protein YeaZ